MSGLCFVLNCSTNNGSFYKFPGSQIRKNDWLKRLGRTVEEYNAAFENSNDLMAVLLCARHFSNEQFMIRNGNPIMKPDAVPDFHLFDTEIVEVTQGKKLKTIETRRKNAKRSTHLTGSLQNRKESGNLRAVRIKNKNKLRTSKKNYSLPVKRTSNVKQKISSDDIGMLSPNSLNTNNELGVADGDISNESNPLDKEMSSYKGKKRKKLMKNLQEEPHNRKRTKKQKHVSDVAQEGLVNCIENLESTALVTPLVMRCRLCAESTDDLLDIFGHEGKHLNLSVKIAVCLPLQLEKNPKLPLKTCRACVDKVLTCYRIVVDVINANEKLERLLEQESLEIVKESATNIPDKTKQALVRKSLLIPKKKLTIPKIFSLRKEPSLPQISKVIDSLKLYLGIRENISLTDLYNVAVNRSLSHKESRNNKYMCLLCNQEQKSFKMFMKHLLLTLKCAYCNVRFCCKSLYHVHTRESHPETCQYKCYKCFVTYSSLNLLTQHKYLLHGLECDFCNKVFVNRMILIKHIRRHIDNLICMYCSKEFKFKSRYLLHLKSCILNTEPIKEFECNVCKRTFVNEINYNDHLDSHNPDYHSRCKYFCSYCDKGFMFQWKLNSHVRNHLDKKFKCSVCSKMLRNDSEYRYHLESHDEIGKYTCDFCNTKFRHKVHLSIHIRNKHLTATSYSLNMKEDTFNDNQVEEPNTKKLQPNFKCHICSKEFQAKVRLSQHMYRQHKVKYQCYNSPNINKPEISADKLQYQIIPVLIVQKFQCQVCPESFNTEDELMFHMSQHEPLLLIQEVANEVFDSIESLSSDALPISHPKVLMSEKFSCPKCTEIFNSVELLTVHMTTHNEIPIQVEFQCSECTELFNSPESLSLHMQTHGGDQMQYQCSECTEVCNSTESLSLHMAAHTSRNKQKFKCSKCTLVFNTIKLLSTHISTKHKELKSYKCSVCDAQFKTRSTKYAHELRHDSTKRKHTCDICEKTFYESSKLKSHKRSHTTEKPFKCTICSKTFAYRPNLNTHQRTHVDDKRFKCTHCGDSFVQKNALTRHLKMHTQNKTFKCKYCSYTCDKKKVVLNHIEKVHEAEELQTKELNINTSSADDLVEVSNSGNFIFEQVVMGEDVISLTSSIN